MTSEKPALTPERFEAAFVRPAKPEKLWGAPAIAAALGVSVDKVYRLARMPEVPIFKPPGGGYFAVRSEIQAWLRSKPSTTVSGPLGAG